MTASLCQNIRVLLKTCLCLWSKERARHSRPTIRWMCPYLATQISPVETSCACVARPGKHDARQRHAARNIHLGDQHQHCSPLACRWTPVSLLLRPVAFWLEAADAHPWWTVRACLLDFGETSLPGFLSCARTIYAVDPLILALAVQSVHEICAKNPRPCITTLRIKPHLRLFFSCLPRTRYSRTKSCTSDIRAQNLYCGRFESFARSICV